MIAMSNTAASYLHFFWAGLVKHGQTGGLVPSQRFLIAKMIAPIPESYCGQVIELGAGNGALTLRLAAYSGL
jgi:phospholipid N-methyltransferase